MIDMVAMMKRRIIDQLSKETGLCYMVDLELYCCATPNYVNSLFYEALTGLISAGVV